MKILLDNGHGCDTAGKRSPDGRFREYLYARMVAREVVRILQEKGLDAECLVPEDTDMTLAERARRANEYCGRLGADKVVLVSVHCNAAGNGAEWMKATGWSAYTSKGQTRADELATLLYAEAEKYFAGQKLRKDPSDGDPDWEEGFYILRKTRCAAVLTENFFQDNRDDVAYLQSHDGFRAVVQTHVDALIQYAERYG